MANPFDDITTQPTKGAATNVSPATTSNPFDDIGGANPFDDVAEPRAPVLGNDILQMATKAATGMITPAFMMTLEQSALPRETKDAFYKSVGKGGVAFGNEALLGLPNLAAKRMGFSGLAEEPQGAGEKVATGLGGLGGFIAGPAKLGGKIAAKIPFLAKAFTPAKTMTQAIAKPIIRGAGTLGVASGLMTPERGLLAPKERGQQLLSGATTGAAFGALGFVPNTPARMLASSAFVGIPSTLRNEPLEDQVFNYGLGAYFGKHGKTPAEVFRAEHKLIELYDTGVSERDSKTFIDKNKKLLGMEKTIAESASGEPITRKDRFRNITKTRDTSGVELGPKSKRNIAREIRNRINELGKNPSFALESGDVEFIANYVNKDLKKSTKKMEKLDTQTLLNMKEVLKSYTPSTKTPFEAPPPLKPEYAGRDWRKKINPWDRFLRPQLYKLQKMGLGKYPSEGLTGEFFESGTAQAESVNRYLALRNNWQRVLGNNKGRSNAIFNYLDGRMSKKKLVEQQGQKSLEVASQMRQYLDTLLVQLNKKRSLVGEDPIRKRKNYITHLFEDYQRELSAKKQPFPDWLEDALPHIIPKKKAFPFEKERIGGAVGFEKDVWKALDSYSRRAAQSLNDNHIRRTNKIIKYIDKQMNYEKKTGDISEIDLKGIKDNLNEAVSAEQGRPGKLDKTLRGAIDPLNAVLTRMPGKLEIKSVGDLVDGFTSLVYGTQMGYNPRLPIRNLGQHSLIIGQTGFKPLTWALRPGNAAEKSAALAKSRVWAGRQRHFAPETQGLGTGGKLKKIGEIGTRPFAASDRRNVKSAFLSGYREAKLNPKKYSDPIKRGDQVAAITQYIYLPQNRSDLARFWGHSRHLGRPLSIFTTWPSNYIEFNLMSAKPENRKNLMKYYATALVGTALLSTMGIRGAEYFGLTSPKAIIDLLRLKFPVQGISSRMDIQGLNILSDVLSGDKSLKEALFYTYR